MNKKYLIIAFLLAIYGVVQSQNIQQRIDKVGDSKAYPKADYLIVFDSTTNQVENSGLTHVNAHRLYKILNQNGAKHLRVLTFDYDPFSAYIEIRKTVIWRKSGKKEVLDMSKVQDYPAPARAIYWGARQKMVDIGQLEIGDAIEVEYYKKGYTYALLMDESSDDKYIPPMRGHFYDIVRFFAGQPILEKYYQVIIPNDKFLQYKFYNGEVASSVENRKDKIVYTFVKKDILPLKREHRMVSLDNVAPKLLLSTSPDWEAKSRWFYNVNEDFGSFKSTPDIDKKVDEILREAKNEDDSISLLTHWVADNIRYSGISMGKGEGYTLHTGNMTFTDRCGVCKDKAGMLITMLRAAGFNSYAAMTMAGSRIDKIPADQFNHSVTVVQRKNGDYQMLDPTWVPFVRELWSSAEQQQNYLMGLPKGADLMRTPVSNPNNHYMTMDIHGSLSENGDLKGKIFIEAEGQTDASIRRMFTSNFQQNWVPTLQKELLKIHPDIEIIDINYGKNPLKHLEGPIKITVKFKVPHYAQALNGKLIYQPICGTGIFKRGMSHLYFNTSEKEKTYGFRDRCSRKVSITEIIDLPKHSSVETITKHETEHEYGITFEGNITVKPKNLMISQQIVLPKRVYQPEEWTTFKQAVEKQRKISKNPIIIKQ